MKRALGVACMLSFCFVTDALAQWPIAPLAAPKVDHGSRHSPGTQVSFGEMQPTPAMWFYEQERRRFEDPQAAVRANAEFRNAQRLDRIAAREHYGISVARPANIHAPAYSPLASPLWYGAVPRTTVIVVPEKSTWR